MEGRYTERKSGGREMIRCSCSNGIKALSKARKVIELYNHTTFTINSQFP
jgi:hypothetical protein